MGFGLGLCGQIYHARLRCPQMPTTLHRLPLKPKQVHLGGTTSGQNGTFMNAN